VPPFFEPSKRFSSREGKVLLLRSESLEPEPQDRPLGSSQAVRHVWPTSR
jgi:hypothetical protein